MVQPVYTTSGFQFDARDRFEHAARQLDTNDLLEMSDPDSLMGEQIYQIITNIFNEFYIGPQGPQGEVGPQGPQGIQGVKGNTGDQGLPADNILPFQANGTLTAKTWPTSFRVTRGGNFRVWAACPSRGSGDSLIVNVHVDGDPVGILSAPDRPTIVAGSGLGSDSGGIIALTNGQYITAVTAEQVGTGWVGLTVQLIEE